MNDFNPVDEFGRTNDTNLISGGFAWPLSQRWSTLAYAQYNISKIRPDGFYGGFQFDTCCWTFRAIAARNFDNEEKDAQDQVIENYKDSFYIQLQLKSLGSIGTSPGNLLTNTLTGFNDPFKSP